MPTTPSGVVRGRGYQGLDAYEIVNPDAQQFHPGRTVSIRPDAPESDGVPSWRAILAGFDPMGNAIVVPLQGHFGELRARKVYADSTGFVRSLALSKDAPSQGGLFSTPDECDWTEAKALALNLAYTFDLQGRP